MCRGKEIRERKTRLSCFDFTFVREAEIVLFVLCMCAVSGVVLQPSVVVYFLSVTRMTTFNLAFEESKVPGPLTSNMGGLEGSGITAFTYFEWH